MVLHRATMLAANEEEAGRAFAVGADCTANPQDGTHGKALGPGNDIAVGCREGTTGSPLLVQIMNRSTGAIVASVNAGGGDQIEYEDEDAARRAFGVRCSKTHPHAQQHQPRLEIPKPLIPG